MKQCWAVGFSILEISKYVMQSLYYDCIQPAFGVGKVSVVMSDTDSFLLAIKGASPDEAMKKLAPVMDFSNLDPSHPLHDVSRNKKPGYLKNEVPGARILEAVAVRSKSYAYRTDAGRTQVAAKGVTGRVRKILPFSAFLQCVEEMKKLEVKQRNIVSKNHVNRMLEGRKIAFSAFDDKRYQLCSLHSVPYGSRLISMSRRRGVCPFCDKTGGRLYWDWRKKKDGEKKAWHLAPAYGLY